MSKFSIRLGWTLVGASLLLNVFTVYCFLKQPDRLSAFTVMPIWLWGGVGLVLSGGAFYFLRASHALTVTAVWIVTLLLGADEAQVLTRIGRSAPEMGITKDHGSSPVLRVITLNCAMFSYGSPAKDLAAWHPDIVLLQEAAPFHVRQIAEALYSGSGDYRAHYTNGVVTRWKITREIDNLALRNEQVTIRLPNGAEIEAVNVHLQSAATDLRLWQRSAWASHRNNRVLRRKELSLVLQNIKSSSALNTPMLVGGDFNAPASDIVLRQLSPELVDSFSVAGTGWGNTFQRRFPILRIDHLYATRHFTPVRSGVAITRHSDHRMVITDFLTNPPISR